MIIEMYYNPLIKYVNTIIIIYLIYLVVTMTLQTSSSMPPCLLSDFLYR